jgi:hypothetical protein
MDDKLLITAPKSKQHPLSRFHFRLTKAQFRILDVAPITFNREPAATKPLGDRASGIRPGERVQHQLAGLRQKLDKESG